MSYFSLAAVYSFVMPLQNGHRMKTPTDWKTRIEFLAKVASSLKDFALLGATVWGWLHH